MHKHDGRSRSAPASISTTPTAQELEGAIDSGRMSDEVLFHDHPAAARLSTFNEGAGTPDRRALAAIRSGDRTSNTSGLAMPESGRLAALVTRPRPLSPNIQIYRPQLTSVLSIANRITGVVLSAGAVALVVWLVAAAAGPQKYNLVQGAISCWIGQVVLFGFTFAFFLHFCGGIRHLVWDTVHGFELRSIYLGGWIVVSASLVLTATAWVASIFMEG